jgi:hypothetical protein
MGRSVIPFVFALAFTVSALAQGRYAAAGLQWCEEDPVFIVNGALLDVTAAMPADALPSLRGPVEFELLVPANATAAVVSIPSNIPATAKITRSLPATWGPLSPSVPVVVKVTVSARDSFDTSTRVTGTYLWLSSTVWGKSNATTRVSYTLLGL